jgi:hypothetical protein
MMDETRIIINISTLRCFKHTLIQQYSVNVNFK